MNLIRIIIYKADKGMKFAAWIKRGKKRRAMARAGNLRGTL